MQQIEGDTNNYKIDKNNGDCGLHVAKTYLYKLVMNMIFICFKRTCFQNHCEVYAESSCVLFHDALYQKPFQHLLPACRGYSNHIVCYKLVFAGF